MSEKQQKAIDIQFMQYKSNSKNSTLQKMVVDSDCNQFFYNVKPVAI